MVLLKPGEQMLNEEKVTMVKGGRTHSGGSLIVTDRRLVYEMAEKGGLFRGGSTTTLVDIHLTKIYNVSESKPLIKIPFVTKNILRVELSDGAVDFAVKDPTNWKTILIQAKQKYEMEKTVVREEEGKKDFEKELLLRRAGATQISVGGGVQSGGGGTKACIMCGEDIPVVAKFCPHCKSQQG